MLYKYSCEHFEGIEIIFHFTTEALKISHEMN